MTGGTVRVTSNKYKAELVTRTEEQEPILPKEIKEGKDLVKVPPAIVDFIRKYISEIQLKPVLSDYSFMPVSVLITEKGAMMACYDRWHMAFVSDKEVTGDFKLTLPAPSLDLLVKEFRGKSYSMQLTDTTLYAFNDSFELSLSLPQQDAQNVIAPEVPFNLAKSIYKNTEAGSIVLSTEDLMKVTDNMRAVYKVGGYIVFDVDNDICKVTIKSTHGKVSSAVRCKSKVKDSFRLGYGYVLNILGKLKEKSIQAYVVPNKMVFFKRGNAMFSIGQLAKEE